MTAETTHAPIKTGAPWGSAEVAAWRSERTRQRSYEDDVLRVIERFRTRFTVVEYGRLSYGAETYPLVAVKTLHWRGDRPTVLVTGGVHGYETSGVHGALQFIEQHAERYSEQVNVVVAPCVSPWAYERVQRWNPEAIDPNRSFRENSSVQESAALMRFVATLRNHFLLHIDLHETTNTDESEFRPTLAARDDVTFEPGEIPDGFYLCGDAVNPQLLFQQAVIESVAKVTHIAPPDAQQRIIGSPVVAPGVILYPYRELGLCAGMTDARYTTTTEVYPDSARVTPEQCNAAQVAAVCAAINFALTH